MQTMYVEGFLGEEEIVDGRPAVTLADIAEAAQVSISTVSRILHQRNGTIKISQETSERVLAVAKSLGYEPNPFASALRTQKTGVLGVIVRDISDPFLRLLMRGLQKAAHKAGFEVLIGHAEEDFLVAERQLQVMLTHWFDGLFLLGNVPGDGALVGMLRQRQTPFVAVACGKQVDVPFVTIDDCLGTDLALKHLSALGHQRIAFIGDVTHAGGRERLAQYRVLRAAYGLFEDERFIQLCGSKQSEAIASVERLLGLEMAPTALFCATDLLALGAMSGVWRRGGQVPEEVSIVGFDDIEEAAESFPALTTVRQPVDEMAQRALELLQSLMKRSVVEEIQPENLIVPQLIERASCAPLLM